MRKPLTIAVAQPPVVAHDVEANARAHAEAVRSAAARVVVFPELSITGYELDAEAIRADDARLGSIREACAETGSIALVGAPVEGDDGQVHIAMLAVDGSGARVAYRKMYLGTTEAERFSPGPDPAAIDVDGWRLGLGICKDTGVPEHAAATAALGIDAYVAGTVKHHHEATLQDERACRIATEHGVWVAIASMAGSTGAGYARAAGRSSIWRGDGVPVSRAGTDVGEIVRASLT